MCRQVTCRTCKKPTWAGCGAHVEQVLRDVPRAARCQCAAGTPPPKSPGWLARRRATKASSTR